MPDASYRLKSMKIKKSTFTNSYCSTCLSPVVQQWVYAILQRSCRHATFWVAHSRSVINITLHMSSYGLCDALRPKASSFKLKFPATQAQQSSKCSALVNLSPLIALNLPYALHALHISKRDTERDREKGRERGGGERGQRGGNNNDITPTTTIKPLICVWMCMLTSTFNYVSLDDTDI